MDWKQISKLDFTEDEMKIVDYYCKDNMRQLKKVCIPLITNKNVAQMEYDDLYSDALNVLIESVKDYKGDKSKFSTYLIGNIKRSFYDWTRDRLRWKRCNLETDENGKVKKDGSGLPIPIKNIPLDAPNDDGIDWSEKIVVEENNNNEYSSGFIKYMNSLSKREKEIAKLIMQGYQLNEIQDILHIPEKKFIKIIGNMKSFEKRKMLKANVKEEKPMNNAITTTLEKSKPDKLSISSIIKKINNYTVRFDHPLQRESEMWSNVMKGNLVSDILQGNPIPALTFAEQIINGIAIIWDLDGKQRCTNVYSFANDGFKVSKNVRRWLISYQAIVKDENNKPILDENGFPQTEKREFDIRNKKFSDLPEELQDKFMDYNFEITQYLNCSSEDIAYHIARYNEGKPMNTQQKGIISLGEHFASLVKGIAAMPFFKEMGNYTVKECNNGTTNRVVVESIMANNFLDDWKKDQSEICEFLKENANEEIFDNFEELVNRLSKIIDEETLEKFNSKDSFIWFGLFGRFVNICDDDKKFIEFMAEFSQSLHSKEINGISFDSLCFDKETGKSRSTKDKYIVVDKINLLVKLLEDFLHTDNKDEENEIEVENNTDVLKSETDIESNLSYETELSFVQGTVKPDAIEEDIQEYEGFLENTVRCSSPIYQRCKKALLALVAYVYSKDQDEEFSDWIERYQDEKVDFYDDQKENYKIIRNDFCKYIAAE